METIEQELSFVEEKIHDWQCIDKKRMVLIQEKIATFMKYIEWERSERSFEDENFIAQLQTLEARLQEKFAQDRHKNEDMEQRLMHAISDKFRILTNSVSCESRERFDLLENLKECLQNDVPKIYQLAKAETQEREQSDKKLQSRIVSEVSRIAQTVNDEKKERIETEEGVQKILKEMLQKLRKDLSGEKELRTANEESLLQLLEQTTARLNQQVFLRE